MLPPAKINVLDQHKGFTAVTTKRGDTLWRPGLVLRGNQPIGTLIRFDEHSFFQNNNDVTKAVYKVKGYRYNIVIWFDNQSRRRIA
jgi:hypothetical protein